MRPDTRPLGNTPGVSEPLNRWIAVRGDELLVRGHGADAAVFPEGDEPPLPGECHPIGEAADGTRAFAIDVADGIESPEGWSFLPIRPVAVELGRHRFAEADRAIQRVRFVRTHVFCGACGTRTEPDDGGRARRCPSCGHSAWPRYSPAMIVRVTRGDELLLARGVRFPGVLYSVLAGFVEPGESIEDSVHREVREEVGITVRDVRYVESQSWPFPHSLMIGMTAEWESGELRPDPEEIVDVSWFRRDDALPALPPEVSIARRLIDSWLVPDELS